MNQKDMLERCKERGVDVTAPLLYRAGKREGFLIKVGTDTREKYQVSDELFEKWLNSYTHNIPDDYILIGDALRIYHISYNALKYRLERNNCEIKKLGVIRGGLYCAKRADVERVIAQYSKRSTKRQSSVKE